MIKIVSVIGARPQFIKAAPVEMAMMKQGEIEHFSVHTGQHYDANMSQIFFDELGLQKPYKNLEAGSGSHATQTAAIMLGLEPVLQEIKPDVLLVYGDTNSTIAAALVAAKLHIPVAHVEAGLRSNNKQMPEEINRILTDHASDLLFAPTHAAVVNLNNEGIQKVFETGDVMMDMVEIAKTRISGHRTVQDSYIYATLHRPYNTDSESRLKQIFSELNSLGHLVVFSLHPRTRSLMTKNYGINPTDYTNISFIDPQGYFENLAYLQHAECLITDSGGMQKEAYFLEKKCITLRSETEWTETLENNCNSLIWDDLKQIGKEIGKPFGPFRKSLYGNGKSAERIVEEIVNFTKSKKQK